MSNRLLTGLICLSGLVGCWDCSLTAAEPVSKGLFARKNLVAWCIVPFDAKKRGPEERAAMLQKLGFTRFAYDYRAEHIPTFDDEIEALKRHHVELSAWWFPTSLNDEARMTLALFARHQVTPELWVTGGGGPVKNDAEQQARIAAETARIRPIAEAAAKVGCRVALYNHGGWFGEPENQIAIIDELKLDNVGLVYNLHHGHDHLDRFPALLQKMKPYLYTLNLNGMVKQGDRQGRKILQLGQGDLDLKLLKIVRDSGYTGPIGILGHTQDDAEERLQDNLDGLDWLMPQLDGQEPGPKPKMRTPVPPPVAAAPLPPPFSGKPLVEGKFGQALDGRAGGATVASRQDYGQFPITVECWTRLTDKSTYNILIAHEPKSSGTHWEMFSMAGNGRFTAYLPGFVPDHCNSTAMICDDNWHHLAMVLEPQQVRLYVDGKQVAVQPHHRSDRPTVAGGLAIASLVDRAIGCTGLVDEVRISKGVRPIGEVPAAPSVSDDTTISLWHLDELVDSKRFEDASPHKNFAVLGDARADAAKPASGTSKSNKVEGHWGENAIGFRWTESDSRDDRFGRVDGGPFFSGSITGAGGPVYKGIVVRIGSRREASACYDTELLRMSAGWNGFLRFDPARFGVIVPPAIDGKATFATPRFPGVSLEEQFTNYRQVHPYGPLPKKSAHYKRLYRHGQRVVLEYTVGLKARADPTSEMTVLESPWLETLNGETAITRTWRFGPSDVPIWMLVADANARVSLHPNSELTTLISQPAVGRVMVIPAHNQPMIIKLLVSSADTNEAAFDQLVAASPVPEDLQVLCQPGPTLWGPPLVTKGELASELAEATRIEPTSGDAGSTVPKPDRPAYVVDTITLPFDNPFNALFFCGGHDFLPDGRAAICTLHGDVWLVDGIDETLQRITWRRFATGLFQPLGLKVVNGFIHVVGRDQITCLRDLNGDGEADVYDNFNNDAHVTLNGHEYVTCLETDRAGNFYTIKGNCNSQTPHDGCLLRVTADGSRLDVFATGFRNSNGIGMGPNDEITVAPQEGEWTPASAVFLVREGGFYGGMMSHHRPTAPTDFERPLVWFPRLADNSSGGQAWTTSNNWGPLSNQLLHMSYGQCRLRLVLQDSRKFPDSNVNNGGSVELPLHFNSGIHRGRMNPRDGQLYVSGLKGWTTSAVHDGCFQRVRYTGQSLDIPVGLKTYRNGIALTFTQELDRAVAEDVVNYQLEAWNYKWSAAYGSAEYRPSAAGQTGRDEIEVRSVTLQDDNRTVFLEIPDLRPVDQLSIAYSLLSHGSRDIEQTVVLTLNSVPAESMPETSLHRPVETDVAARNLVPGIRLSMARDAAPDAPADGHSLVNTPVRRLAAWTIGRNSSARRGTGTQRVPGLRTDLVLKVPFTGDFSFSFDGNGTARLEVDGGPPHAMSALSPITVRLKRGYCTLGVSHQIQPDTDIRFRLMWESRRFPRESVPADLLFHETAGSEGKDVGDLSRVSAMIRRGRVLYVEHQCANCHQSSEAFLMDTQGMPESLRRAPGLAGIGSRLTRVWLLHWLRDPNKLRNHATMAGLFPAEGSDEIADIVAYLETLKSSPSADVPASATDFQHETQSIAARGAELYERIGCIACHTLREQAGADEWQRVSLGFVASKFRAGQLTAFLLKPHQHHSGSRMPDFHLQPDEARSLAAYLLLEARGKLPGIADIADGHVERGRQAFDRIGCANCHNVETHKQLKNPHLPGMVVAGSKRGCLSNESQVTKSPRFYLAPDDREALQQYIASLARPTDSRTVPEFKARNFGTDSHSRLVASLRCHACHAQDRVRPVWPEVVAEEGSGKPTEPVPQLTWVGEKLQGPWIEKLLRGEVQKKPRPWLTARMPAFPAYASVLAHGMAAEHGVSFEEPLPELGNFKNVEMGRRLTLRDGGLDCRQCHGVGNEQPRGDASTQIALGINFALTRSRLRPEFALRQMLDPPRYDIGSRMPRFAPDLRTTAAKQIENGDARKQFESLKEFIWSVTDE